MLHLAQRRQGVGSRRLCGRKRDIANYEYIAGKTVLLTWLRNMSAYSAGHNLLLCTALHSGSTNNNIASHKMEVLLASATYS